ncbi:hypothetical protein EJ02DRAFT_459798 [Clathrospora elynae]|uniref:TNFR-Cys domain-containing protein n=1 Tax=Clathrospora elynae TaxID=706981 RepID=A0A6A5S9H0_9PLEO|nr:hypothetical protein EJ02DRAFT_459798 [Clathrospora elynae]
MKLSAVLPVFAALVALAHVAPALAAPAVNATAIATLSLAAPLLARSPPFYRGRECIGHCVKAGNGDHGYDLLCDTCRNGTFIDGVPISRGCTRCAEGCFTQDWWVCNLCIHTLKECQCLEE